MKIGIVILCRYNSNRLPGKILLKINEKSIIHHIYERLAQVVSKDQIIVATSDEKSDDIIDNFCKSSNIPVFRGSLDDVSDRFLSAAKHLKCEYVIRINGDNLFIDTDALKTVIKKAESKRYDFISNVKKRTYPYGMSIECLNVTFYEQVFKKLDSDYYKEHVTKWLYDHEDYGNRYYLYNTQFPEAHGAHLAIDTEEDFLFAQLITKKLGLKFQDYSLQDILNALKNEKQKK